MPHPTPIVFLHPSDPVRDGLADSLSRPDRNLTGVFGARDVVAKQLELYQLLVPKLHTVLTLVDPDGHEDGVAPGRVQGRGGRAAATDGARHPPGNERRRT